MEPERVRQEVDMLRKELTPEEKSKLDFSTFNGHSGNLCIYGQATGSCTGERVDDLMSKAGINRGEEPEGISPLEVHVFNGTYHKEFNSEVKHQDNERIISYIKGEIDELTLTNY